MLTTDHDALVGAAQECAALARDLADDIERERRLPDALLARLRDARLLRAGAPVEVAGGYSFPTSVTVCVPGGDPPGSGGCPVATGAGRTTTAGSTSGAPG